MADDKKISQLVELTTLDGEEQLVVRKGSGNNSVSVNTLKSNIRSGMVAQQPGKGLSANDYTNEEKFKLSALPTNAELTASLAAKQDAIVASEDIVPQSGGKLTLTQKAKMALYNDMWDLLTNGYGGYKPTEAPDAAHPYLLNKLWLTYQEAVEVYLAWKMTPNDSKTRYFRNKSIRTTLPAFPTPSIYECDYTFTECLLLETVRINNISAGERTFYGCRKLRTINSVYTITTDNAFFGCESLEELTITGTQSKNVNLQWSPLISMASLNSIIQHANAAIVITVHPIVYAKLTDETNTEWNGVLSAAEAKNITFATTE